LRFLKASLTWLFLRKGIPVIWIVLRFRKQIVSDYFIWSAIGFIGGVVYCSFFEWTLHKYVMHQPLGFFDYPFRAHAVTHHGIFKSDHSYHLQDIRYKKTVPMAWWNAPVMWLLHVPPILLAQMLVGRPIFWGAIMAMVIYYAVYESIHWCMHVPRKRNIERSGIFFRLNGHHLLHHRYMGKNLNVVLPLADLFMGTLVLRSPIKFAQARGPMVPNVQPIQNAERGIPPNGEQARNAEWKDGIALAARQTADVGAGR